MITILKGLRQWALDSAGELYDFTINPKKVGKVEVVTKPRKWIATWPNYTTFLGGLIASGYEFLLFHNNRVGTDLFEFAVGNGLVSMLPKGRTNVLGWVGNYGLAAAWLAASVMFSNVPSLGEYFRQTYGNYSIIHGVEGTLALAESLHSYLRKPELYLTIRPPELDGQVVGFKSPDEIEKFLDDVYHVKTDRTKTVSDWEKEFRQPKRGNYMVLLSYVRNQSLGTFTNKLLIEVSDHINDLLDTWGYKEPAKSKYKTSIADRIGRIRSLP